MVSAAQAETSSCFAAVMHLALRLALGDAKGEVQILHNSDDALTQADPPARQQITVIATRAQ